MNTQSLHLSTKHMTMELGFIPTRGIFALRSSVHTSRTISQCSKNHSQLSKVKIFHDDLLITMMIYSSLKESQRINYTTFATPCKEGFESFSFFSLHIVNRVKPPDSRPPIHRHQRKTRPDKAQSFLIACPLLSIVIHIQLSKVKLY